jgi:DNA-binding response OmpR family regulator
MRQGQMSEQARVVLLIEDDASTADMYALSLSISGFLVWVAHSAEAGLRQIARGGSPNLILLDLELGNMGGLDMLVILHDSPSTSHIPVIVLSNQGVDFAEASRRGATECLAKHRTTPGELVSHVQAALSRHAELAAAAFEHALAQQQRALASKAFANAGKPLGHVDQVAAAQAELFAGWAQMHFERARAHEARAARHFREATRHDRDADAQGQRLLAAAERLDEARHGAGLT